MPTGFCVEDSSATPLRNVSFSVDEKALVRKIDARVLPMLFIIYVAAFLDRINIANALTMGMPTDLGLSGSQPNAALAIFFVPYILFEIPSNILMKKFKPHVWLSTCILSFGLVTVSQGFVKNFGGILTTRMFLGLAEAGIFPGSVYLISIWYKREEAQQRFTFYWCSVLTASASGGLLATGIANMDGLGGLHSWQWIFVLEGIFTVVIGIASYFFLSDFPEDASWLTEEERRCVIRRAGDHQSAKPVRPRDILDFFSDMKNILAGIMYLCVVMPGYTFSYFAPTIVKTLGYSVVQTQLHTVPPVAAALVLCIVEAYVSDRVGVRSPFIFLGLALSISGFAILMTVHDNFSAEYGAVCLIAMGSFSTGCVIVCWYVMNLHGHVQRAIGSAYMIGFGNLSGVVATFSFLASDAPLYHTGYTICMASSCLCALAVSTYAFLVFIENRKLRETGETKRLSL